MYLYQPKHCQINFVTVISLVKKFKSIKLNTVIPVYYEHHEINRRYVLIFQISLYDKVK